MLQTCTGFSQTASWQAQNSMLQVHSDNLLQTAHPLAMPLTCLCTSILHTVHLAVGSICTAHCAAGLHASRSIHTLTCVWGPCLVHQSQLLLHVLLDLGLLQLKPADGTFYFRLQAEWCRCLLCIVTALSYWVFWQVAGMLMSGVACKAAGLRQR